VRDISLRMPVDGRPVSHSEERDALDFVEQVGIKELFGKIVIF
jgi:hypothetical protein